MWTFIESRKKYDYTGRKNNKDKENLQMSRQQKLIISGELARQWRMGKMFHPQAGH